MVYHCCDECGGELEAGAAHCAVHPSARVSSILTRERWWRFAAYNTEACYGCGVEWQAEQYVARLNRGRDVNWYYYSPVDEPAVIARLPGYGFDLGEALAELEGE